MRHILTLGVSKVKIIPKGTKMIELFHLWLLMVVMIIYAVTMFVFVLLSVKSRISFSDENPSPRFAQMFSTSKAVLTH